MFILFEHLEELKYRILYIFLGFISYFILFYFYAAELLFIIVRPLETIIVLNKLIYTNLTDVFLIYFKLACCFSLLLTLSYIFYHILCFLSPGLYEYEVWNLIRGGIYIYLLLISMLLGFYYIFIPLVWSFFIDTKLAFFEIITLSFEVRITEYFNLIFKFLFVFLFTIQIPIYILFYIYSNFLDYTAYKLYRSLFFSIICIYVLILGPPDIIVQLMIISFIICIIEVLILIHYFYIIIFY